jgi:hypothetical protein
MSPSRSTAFLALFDGQGCCHLMALLWIDVHNLIFKNRWQGRRNWTQDLASQFMMYTSTGVSLIVLGFFC